MRKSLKIYFTAAILLIIFVVFKRFTAESFANVAEGIPLTEKSSSFNKLISDSVNSKTIKLVVDGREVETDSKSIIMDENMEFLIDYDILTDAFSCAADKYYSSLFILQKYLNRTVLHINEDKAVINDETVELPATVCVLDNRIYIPSFVVEKVCDYSASWDVESGTVTYTNLRPDEKIFPYMYDYRVAGKVSPAKNQSSLGTCWAFASLMALESSLAPELLVDFSEDHMTLHSGFASSQNDGGEYSMAMAYLTSWAGPVFEADDPYGDGYSPEGLEPVVHVQEIQIIESKNYDDIKKAIFLRGGVQSSLYVDIENEEDAESGFYNIDTAAYCYMGPNKPNHDIVIIGWDDTYPAAKFLNPPSGDGAFICVNSWGTGFGEDGTFYVSYYDSNIGMHNAVYTGIEYNDNYDNIYQSDICGMVGQVGYSREYAYFANVYTAKEDEILRAVGFYATGQNTDYEVYLVENFEDETSLSERKLLGSGRFQNAGFYTVDVGRDNHLEKGKKYAVMVYINTPGSSRPVAVEFAADQSTQTVTLEDGEGYISLHGNVWQNVETVQECNVCLKMYTDNER